MHSSFETTLAEHLHAIQYKNIEQYAASISDTNIVLILLNGTILNTKEAVIQLHTDWFSDEDWSIEFTIQQVIEQAYTQIVLLDVKYHDVDSNKNPYTLHYLLSLVFALEEGIWKLIYDQNTPIK